MKNLTWIVGVALNSFHDRFRNDEEIERGFQQGVIGPLLLAYRSNPPYLEQRFNDIIRNVQSITDKRLLKRYFDVERIIGVRPLARGDVLYYFSNTKYDRDWSPEAGVILSSSTDYWQCQQSHEEIDFRKIVYMHTVEVTKPDKLLDVQVAEALNDRVFNKIPEGRDNLIEDYVIKPLHIARWYKVLDIGSVKMLWAERANTELPEGAKGLKDFLDR